MNKLMLMVFAVSMLFVGGCSRGVDVTKFQIVEFNGHSYVAYDGGNYDSGLVHNPDCKCLNKPN